MGRLMGDDQRASVAAERMTLVWSPESIRDLIALRAPVERQINGPCQRATCGLRSQARENAPWLGGRVNIL